MPMIGVTLTFTKQIATGVDAMNNPVYTPSDIVVDDCLIAPIREPYDAREQLAITQNRDQLRIHMPKSSDADVSRSSVLWDGKEFLVDSDAVVFMPGNTPTRWNRYFRAECVNA